MGEIIKLKLMKQKGEELEVKDLRQKNRNHIIDTRFEWESSNSE